MGVGGEWKKHCLWETHVLSQHNLLNSIHTSLSGWFEWNALRGSNLCRTCSVVT